MTMSVFRLTVSLILITYSIQDSINRTAKAQMILFNDTTNISKPLGRFFLI
jgi:hypothetical protein